MSISWRLGKYFSGQFPFTQPDSDFISWRSFTVFVWICTFVWLRFLRRTISFSCWEIPNHMLSAEESMIQKVLVQTMQHESQLSGSACFSGLCAHPFWFSQSLGWCRGRLLLAEDHTEHSLCKKQGKLHFFPATLYKQRRSCVQIRA